MEYATLNYSGKDLVLGYLEYRQSLEEIPGLLFLGHVPYLVSLLMLDGLGDILLDGKDSHAQPIAFPGRIPVGRIVKIGDLVHHEFPFDLALGNGKEGTVDLYARNRRDWGKAIGIDYPMAGLLHKVSFGVIVFLMGDQHPRQVHVMDQLGKEPISDLAGLFLESAGRVWQVNAKAIELEPISMLGLANDLLLLGNVGRIVIVNISPFDIFEAKEAQGIQQKESGIRPTRICDENPAVLAKAQLFHACAKVKGFPIAHLCHRQNPWAR